MSNHPACSELFFQMPGTFAGVPAATDFDVSNRAGYMKLTDAGGNLLADFGTAPPVPPTLRTFTNPAAGATDKIPAGTYFGILDVPPEAHDYTISGAGRLLTTLDGQRGVGAGHRLAWGKGIIHSRATNVIVADIGFINGGGGDNKSDAEAGVYVGDGQVDLFTVLRCDFSNNEDGVYTQVGSGDLLINQCTFGVNGPNGLDDQLSHDNYVNGKSVTIRGSYYAGNSRGNTVKTRSPRLDISGTYLGRTNGRWIDMPGGTDATSTNNTFVTLNTNSQNAFGLDDELDGNVNAGKAGSFLSVDDTFYFQRFQEIFWINHVASRVEFVRPRVFWIGQPGATPPIVGIQGPGNVVGGVNPFVFNEANRVGAPPAIPVF